MNLQDITIAIIDNNIAFIQKMQKALKGLGANLLVSSNYESSITLIDNNQVDVILAEISVFEGRGFEFLNYFRSINKDSLFYILTDNIALIPIDILSSSNVDDYIQRSVEPEKFTDMIAHRIDKNNENSRALTRVDPIISSTRPYFHFRSPAMLKALENLPVIAKSNHPVLITGETGTGKEIISHAIHMLSRRSGDPFIAVNCGAIPESLIEGELFGHEKGSFTGAYKLRKGKFEVANKGTIFLDEIGDMPLNLQVRLLRVLEEGQLFRVGAETPIPIDVRIIAATRRCLLQYMESGLFRDDLYYRLNVLNIYLPPLRKRIEDIAHLSVHFFERARGEMEYLPPHPTLSTATITLLERLTWKGNVRELRNLMTRVATLIPGNVKKVLPTHILPYIEDTVVPSDDMQNSTQGIFIPIGTTIDKAEKALIDATLKYTNGNRTQTAKLLGIGLRTLRRKLNT
ncbi:MAG: sigma-54 dependent transcriptional regulator [Candidatus Magnetoovum sp. WYHC-5]|nr:sigma-54 dependent transcriptional regulator [Candidatus Magnetoovum sp. WYHC-5]